MAVKSIIAWQDRQWGPPHLACNLLPSGYYFYVHERVPVGKEPRAIDAKLISRYGIDISASARSRRKRAGLANLHYLRFERDFLLLATHGQHEFFVKESMLDARGHEHHIRDVRKVAIKVGGYSVRVVEGGFLRKVARDVPPVEDKKLRVRVQIGRERYLELKGYLLDVATRFPVEELALLFAAVPYEPYAPVRLQLWNLLRWVNDARHAAGLERVPSSVIRVRRRIVKPFGVSEEEAA
jgi:hypothetical protein